MEIHSTFTWRLMIIMTCLVTVHTYPATGYEKLNDTTETSELLKLSQLEDRVFQILLSEYPKYVATLGTSNYSVQGKVQSFTLEAFENRKNRYASVLQSATQIDVSKLKFRKSLDVDILVNYLKTVIDGYKWISYGAMNPVTARWATYEVPLHIHNAQYTTIDDFYALLEYIDSLSGQIHDTITLMRIAINMNTTLHMSVMDGIDIESSKKFMLSVLSGLVLRGLESANIRDGRDELKKEAEEKLQNVNDAMNSMRTFIHEEYLPNTRPGLGVGTMPQGEEFYKACLVWNLGDPSVTPEDVYRFGITEISRIEKRIYQVFNEMNYTGDIREFYEELDNTFNMKEAYGILDQLDEIMKNVVNPNLQQYFYPFPIPDIQYIKVPNSSMTAVYNDNTLYINVENPFVSSVKLSLTIHETNPGHHFQTSYAANEALPMYRAKPYLGFSTNIPFLEPTYSSYHEGWATYAEFLGEEMGLFKTPHEKLDRLRSEMFRACRMVVDVEIHMKGMSKESAIEFFRNHTGMPITMVEAEVDSYISFPGVAPAYKMGELWFRQLRETAELSLGDKFDIREFHHQFLRLGPVPFTVVRKAVHHWITETQSELHNSANVLHRNYVLSIVVVVFNTLEKMIRICKHIGIGI